MSNHKITARASALNHLNAALASGVRGDLREAIHKAIHIAAGDRVSQISDLEYRQLAQGAKLGDPQRPGLLMRHGKRKGRVWLYRFAHPETRKQVELQFARYPETDLMGARAIWESLRAQRQAGLAPSLNRSNAGGSMGPTMRDLARWFISEYANKTKAHSSAKSDARALDRHVLPDFGDMQAVDFGSEQASLILSKIVKAGTPREAEKLRSVLSTMFNVAVGKTRKIPVLGNSFLPPDTKNPVETVMLPKHTAKNHKPTTTELRGYIRGLGDLPFYGDVLRLQIETIARIGEVAQMTWNEVDLDEGVWLLPAERAKNRKAHSVMLARQTNAWLRDQKAISTSRFVFPSPRDRNRFVSTDAVIRNLARNRAGLGIGEDFTSHATRHAALSWLAENGAGRDIRDRVSNHTPPSDGADHIYVNATHNKAAREWTQRWVDYLTGLASDNVLPIRGVSA